MNKYELVILVDSKLPQDWINTVISTVEWLFGASVKDKDDMGMMDTYHEIAWANRAYFVSYFLELDPTAIVENRKVLSLTKWLARFFFYKIWKNEKFLKFKEINKAFELSEEEKQKQKNEKAFQDMDSASKRKGK